jgi:acyl carrier protein
MTQEEIRERVRRIVAGVTGLDAARVGDTVSMRTDLEIDSLSRLEIGVDVDYAFQLKLPDEAYAEIDTVEAMVALVERRLAEKTA